jgi:hypothetical protein
MANKLIGHYGQGHLHFINFTWAGGPPFHIFSGIDSLSPLPRC